MAGVLEVSGCLVGGGVGCVPVEEGCCVGCDVVGMLGCCTGAEKGGVLVKSECWVDGGVGGMLVYLGCCVSTEGDCEVGDSVSVFGDDGGSGMVASGCCAGGDDWGGLLESVADGVNRGPE